MLRGCLANTGAYRRFASLVGANRGRRLYIDRYVQPRAGDRVLDIGCGPADILDALPPVEYHGFDLSDAYIESARKRFGARGQFHVRAVTEESAEEYSGFDLVLATGVLHHLDDGDATALFRVARTALKPGGTLVTLDGCFVNGQSPIARLMLRCDRGKFVRSEGEYHRLASVAFPSVQQYLTEDLLSIPYTHCVMRCTKRI